VCDFCYRIMLFTGIRNEGHLGLAHSLDLTRHI